MSLPTDFIDILCCPKRACRGDLEVWENRLRCKTCIDTYEIIEGIPILFPNTKYSPDLHQRHWDLQDNAKSYAKKYDTYLKKQGNPWGQYTHISELWIIKKLKENLGFDLTNKTVLDLGCGNGRLLTDYPEATRHIGLDASLYLLQAAKKREPNFWFVCGQVEDLPFKDATCDFSVSIRVFQHLRMPEHAFSEMARVTRPSGHVVVEVYNKLNLKELYKRFRMLHFMQKWNPWGLDYDKYYSYKEFNKMAEESFVMPLAYGGAGWGFHFYLFDLIKFRRFAPAFLQKIVFDTSFAMDKFFGTLPFFSKTMEKIVFVGSAQGAFKPLSFFGRINRKAKTYISLKEEHKFEDVLSNRNYSLSGSDEQHLRKSIEWLKLAQNATPDGGVSRGFSLFWNGKFGKFGWQPSYPETTGYIIPTMINAAKVLGEYDLLRRARLMADWELAIIHKDGWVQAGNIAKSPKPEVFDTAQVIRGFTAMFEATGEEKYKDAAIRAANWIIGIKDPHPSYYAYSAAPVVELGFKFGREGFKNYGLEFGNFVLTQQESSGWFNGADFSRTDDALLHTMGYTIDGLWDLGELLVSQEFTDAAKKALDGVLNIMDERGSIPGRLDKDWKGTVDWACLTGIAQIGVTTMKAYKKFGDKKYLEKAVLAKEFLKTTQNNLDPKWGGLGAIYGSWPPSGGYEPHQALNWPLKYFADLLLNMRNNERV